MGGIVISVEDSGVIDLSKLCVVEIAVVVFSEVVSTTCVVAGSMEKEDELVVTGKPVVVCGVVIGVIGIGISEVIDSVVVFGSALLSL